MKKLGAQYCWPSLYVWEYILLPKLREYITNDQRGS